MCQKKRWIAVSFVAVLLVLLGGCAGKFDAAGYTKALLDVTYKNETKRYIELTGSTKKAADRIFTNNLDVTMEGYEKLKLPQELEENYRKLFETLLKSVRYTVGEAKEDKDKNFTVDVSIEPLTIFDDTYEQFQKQAKEYATQISNEVMNGAKMPSDKDMQDHIYEMYYRLLSETLKNGLPYGEKTVVTVHVRKGEADIYEIPKEDLRALDEHMMTQKLLEKSEK